MRNLKFNSIFTIIFILLGTLIAFSALFFPVEITAQRTALGYLDIVDQTGVSPDITSTILIIVNFTISIGVAAFLAMFVWASISWLTAGGDVKNVEAAKSRITAAVIGLILLTISFAIYRIVVTITFPTGLPISI